jgi:peptidyl-tRNA hydrolase
MVADYVLSTFKPNEKVLLQNLETQIFQLINDFL